MQNKTKKYEKRKKDKPEYYFGHQSDNNRFGDTDLSTPFIWKKKWEKQLPAVKGKKLRALVTDKLRQRQSQIQNELEQVNQLRTRRQLEKDAMERMREDTQRQVEMENYGLLNLKEDQFLKEQVREGALLRIKAQRENVFDALFKVAFFGDGEPLAVARALDLAKPAVLLKRSCEGAPGELEYSQAVQAKKILGGVLELRSPYLTLSAFVNAHRKGGESRVRDLREEVGKMLELGESKDYWQNVKFLLDFLEKNEGSLIKEEIFSLLAHKSRQELKNLELEVERKLESCGDQQGKATEVIDYEYWADLLEYIRLFQAKEKVGSHFKNAIINKIEIKELVGLNFVNLPTIPKEVEKDDNIKSGEKLGDLAEIEPAVYCLNDEKEERYINSIVVTFNEFFEKLGAERIKVLRIQCGKKHLEIPITLKMNSNAQELFKRHFIILLLKTIFNY